MPMALKSIDQHTRGVKSTKPYIGMSTHSHHGIQGVSHLGMGLWYAWSELTVSAQYPEVSAR